jgi:hypothetical protein
MKDRALPEALALGGYVRVPEAARILGCLPLTVTRLCKSKKLPSIKWAGWYWIKKSDIEGLINKAARG